MKKKNRLKNSIIIAITILTLISVSGCSKVKDTSVDDVYTSSQLNESTADISDSSEMQENPSSPDEEQDGNSSEIPSGDLSSTDAADNSEDGNEPVDESSEDDSSDDTYVPEQSGDAQAMADGAIAMLGTPFAEGGTTPDGFDSSGFICYIGRIADSKFPRDLADQLAYENAVKVGYEELMTGDIVYFGAAQGQQASYGGIYIGNGKMIYASVPGEVVKEKDITSSYWKNCFVTGLRIS